MERKYHSSLDLHLIVLDLALSCLRLDAETPYMN